MKRRKIKPNDVILVSNLFARGQLGSVEVGEMISNYVESEGLSLNVYVGSVLLDIYAKCGNIGKARQVFNEMPEKDVVSWNSMIAGLAVNGFEEEAINLYFQMNESEAKPNDVTFIALLTACTHAGLVELECRFFKSMRRDHNIKPQVEHCACVVDLFCRPGRLDEAFEFISLAEHAVEKLLLLELENSGNYVLLSNLYASMGRWEESLKTRPLMKEKVVQETAAYN
ncbi:hypothetical protein MRB53_028407 [Persea americana]|uniref:Uncharacterized protein n=1 Tax=Persea americana TaxID=3435 RepID=A0ACC2KFU0_PERAE|nr:hypothetical protein MRB53_028407 [Persea americana]